LGIDQNQWRELWRQAVVKQAEYKAKLDHLFRPDSIQGDLLPTADIRPTQARKRGKKELNYNAPVQVQRAIKQYCTRIGWSREIVVTQDRLTKLKAEYGREWIQSQESRGRFVTAEEVPSWYLPEDRYCDLTSLDGGLMELMKIRRQLPVELVDTYLAYKEWAKKAGTYGIEFLNKHVRKDGRIHPRFHQAVTTTGRISTEPNTQNIPRDAAYRHCFVPRPGYKYIIADFSQIEPRITAQESQDPVYLETYIDGADLYIRVAEVMLRQTVEFDAQGNLTEQWKIHRTTFKTVVLALAYRMGPHKLRNELTIALGAEIMAGKVPLPTIEYATQLHRNFLEVHRGLRAYQDMQSELADPANESRPKLWDDYAQTAVTYVRGLCGRIRCFRPDSRTTYTEGANAPIQGHSATITKYAAVLIQQDIDDRGVDMHGCNYIHDELVYECEEARAEEMAEVVKRRMEEAGKRWLRDIPVVAEFPKHTNGVVDRWLKEAA
jgi:hypothetical protein